MSAAPLGTAERHPVSGPTAPACLALATGTVRRVILRQVRRGDGKGSSQGAVLLPVLDEE